MNRQDSNTNKRNLSRDRNLLAPRRTSNLDHNASKSSVGTYPKEIRLLPLELRPILDQEDRRKEQLRKSSDASVCSRAERTQNYHNDSRIPRRQIIPRCPRSMQRDRCCNTSDVYRNILGPTADESILAGLQTVIDICGLADYCGSDSEDASKRFPYGTIIESYSVSKTKQSSPNGSKRNSINSNGMDDTFATAPSTPTSQEHRFSNDSTISDKFTAFETAQDSYIEPESPRKIRSYTKHEKKMKSSSKEKHRKDSKTTHHPRGTSTPTKRSPSVTINDIPDVSSVRRPSITPPPSPTRQLSPHDMMTHDPYLGPRESASDMPGDIYATSSGSWCKLDECCGTSNETVPCVRVAARDGRQVCIKYKCNSIQSSLSAKCFPPVEIPPCDLSCKECHIVDKGVDPTDLAATISFIKMGADCTCHENTSITSSSKRRRSWNCKREKRDSKSVIIQDPKAALSYVFDPNYTCNPNYEPHHPKLPLDFRFRTIPPAVQPVIGVCNQGKCGADGALPATPMSGDADGERLLEVRYALVRISVFNSYTTYEIMKSSKKKPKNVPDSVEGIFVTKR